MKLIIKKPQTYYFSDLHIGHKNIYSENWRAAHNPSNKMRQFKCMEDGERAMVENYNSIVEDGDNVFFLGDILFNKKRGEHVLNCMKKGNKFLVMGNHDDKGDITFYRQFFKKIYGCLYKKDMKAIISHIPIHPYLLNSDRFNFCLHGHTHDTFVLNANETNRDERYLNACVEVNNYSPVTFEQLLNN